MSRILFTDKAEKAVVASDSTGVAYLTATGPVAGGIAETGRTMPLSGMLYANGTAASTTDASEDTLMKYVLPGTALTGAGKAIKITAFGTTDNTADVKTVKVYLGDEALTTTALTVTSKTNWSAEFIVVSTAADTQAFTGKAGAGATNADLASVSYFGTGDEVTASDLVIKVTGTTADLTHVVTCQMLLVQALN